MAQMSGLGYVKEQYCPYCKHFRSRPKARRKSCRKNDQVFKSGRMGRYCGWIGPFDKKCPYFERPKRKENKNGPPVVVDIKTCWTCKHCCIQEEYCSANHCSIKGTACASWQPKEPASGNPHTERKEGIK